MSDDPQILDDGLIAIPLTRASADDPIRPGEWGTTANGDRWEHRNDGLFYRPILDILDAGEAAHENAHPGAFADAGWPREMIENVYGPLTRTPDGERPDR